MSSEGVTPPGLLDLLGIDYIPRHNRLSFCCPFHHDTNPSTGFYLDTGLCHCFSCDYTLDCAGFYAKHKGIEYHQAERELERVFGEAKEKIKVDTTLMEKARHNGELALASAKEIGIERHSFLGEELDRLIYQFRMMVVSSAELDKSIEMWYNYLLESKRDAGFDPRRAPTISPDGGFEEGMADISGLDGSSESLDLD